MVTVRFPMQLLNSMTMWASDDATRPNQSACWDSKNVDSSDDRSHVAYLVPPGQHLPVDALARHPGGLLRDLLGHAVTRARLESPCAPRQSV
jgi:hypothetical protein